MAMQRPIHATCTGIVVFSLLATCNLSADELRDQLWAAVRNGDVVTTRELLDQGADVNAANEMGVTSLWIAAGKENPSVVKLLVARGADVNARDGIWYQTPLSMAVRGDDDETVKCLLDAGAKDIDDAARAVAAMGNTNRLKQLLSTGSVSQDALDAMLYSTPESKADIRELLVNAGAQPLPAIAESERARWLPLAGTYENDNASPLELAVTDVGLAIKSAQGNTALRESGPNRFVPIGSTSSSINVEESDGRVERVILQRFTAESIYYPARPIAVSNPDAAAEALGHRSPTSTTTLNWPQFRGPDATGIGDGQLPPITWDVTTGENVKWKTAIPGLGHSCPIIWGDRVFVTTAISGDPDPKIRIGNYGDVASVDDATEHTWHVLCVDRETGTVLWDEQVHKGVPKIKRHLKGSQANCTPATDGKHVVACFGSEGLYCFDLEGKLLWSRDLSTIDSSFALDEEYEWGFGSSPILHDGLAIVQFDLSRGSFIAAYSLANGDKVWETPRDEIPSWSSPAIWRNSLRIELVTNASQFARSYDPSTGRELWRIGKQSEATIPAPVPCGDMVIICSGNRPIQPIFAIKPGADGDISLADQESSNEFISWSHMRGGPYMPTPLVYKSHLYVCSNAGVLTCYNVTTGKRVYRERIGGASYTASPVVADDLIYFVAEEGDVRVVKAGPKFDLLAVNKVGDICMASPALSAGALMIRSQHYLFALQRGANLEVPPESAN